MLRYQANRAGGGSGMAAATAAAAAAASGGGISSGAASGGEGGTVGSEVKLAGVVLGAPLSPSRMYEGGTGADLETPGFKLPSVGSWEDGQTSSKDFRLVILGIPLHRFATSQHSQLMVLSATVLVASVTFAAVQERVLYVPGFRYTGWISTLTSLTYVLCSLLERRYSPEPRRLGSLWEYVKLSVLTMGGMYLTNWSLKYLSYPLRVVFKSSKLVPTMMLSVVYLKKRYSRTQYLSVALLTLGVVLFTLGDARGKAVFDPKGLVLIFVGSFAESLAANFEEKRLFNQLGCPATEVLLYSSLFGTVWAGTADVLQGDFLPALRHSRDHPEAVLLICGAAVAGYVAMTGVLVLVKNFGATLAEIVKSCRKILTICISFLLYGKQWTVFHIVGGLFFTSSIAVERFAAGGASRRFAGLFLGGSVLSAILLLVSATRPSTYSVIIDAGSTATRIHIFRFDSWTLRLEDINGAAEVFVSRQPGLAAFASNASAVDLVLGPLMRAALEAVPATLRASTPLALRANAGLQSLPGMESQRLLEESARALKHWGFLDAGVELLPGSDEAVCSWLTVNFLMGSFRPGVQAVHEPLAVFDLRSVSLQAAHFLGDADAQDAKRLHRGHFIKRLALPYGSGNAHIYRHSYVGHGLVAARGRGLKLMSSGNPCLPREANVTMSHVGRELQGTGDANVVRCPALVAELLQVGQGCGLRHNERPADGRCTFGGVWSGPVDERRRVVLVSYFFDRMLEAGLIPAAAAQAILTPSAFTAAGLEVCEVAALGVEAMLAKFPGLSRERATWMCFDLTYLAVMLIQGLGLANDSQLIVVKTIAYDGHSFEATWALGMALQRLAC
mmetsp:Transcript_84876/g.274368  ORF Transcript_84876/g.274368 Transcript_84876/m.274368 type:complete len:844 (-) Transcript_84876:81-2612(-)